MQHIGTSFTHRFCEIYLPGTTTLNEVKHSRRYVFEPPVTDFQLLNENPLAQWRDGLQNFLNEHQIDQAALNIVLPFNQAFVGTAYVPADADKAMKKQQIQWTLSQHLPDPLSEYKISVLDEVDDSETTHRIRMVAIEKALLKKIITAISGLNVELNALLINSFALENFLQKMNHVDGVTHVVKIDHTHIESHFFENGTYSQTYVHSIADAIPLVAGKIAEIINSTTKKYLQLNPETDGQKIRAIVYGNDDVNSLIHELGRKINIQVQPPEIIHPAESEPSALAIEALGALL